MRCVPTVPLSQVHTHHLCYAAEHYQVSVCQSCPALPTLVDWVDNTGYPGTLLTIESLDWVDSTRQPRISRNDQDVIPDTWDVMVDSYPTCSCSVL